MKKAVRYLALSVMLISLFAISGFTSSSYGAQADLFVLSSYRVDEPDTYFSLEFKDGVKVKKVVSSKPSVVSVDEIEGSYVFLNAEKVGTATITATDTNGDTDTCKVTVKPEKFVLDTERLDFEVYEEDNACYVETRSNSISSVVSSNKGVVKVSLESRECFEVTPVSAGTATITVTDVYKQQVTIPVSVTQKYIDDSKYLDYFREAAYDVYYGDTLLYFDIYYRGVSVKVTINGKSYSGKYDEEDFYMVKIPVLPIGTEIKYSLSKGLTKYSSTIKVKAGNLSERAEIYFNKDNAQYKYKGKKLKPSFYVDYYKRTANGSSIRLKKGTDYTVQYKKNKNVGKAKVIVRGKGKYAGKVTEMFSILPKGTSIEDISAASKSFTVKWKKQSEKMSKSRITGYQIRYSTKSSMKGSEKVFVKGYKKTSKVIKKLDANQKYYVQIRTYKTVKSKKYFSDWSSKKTVKTK